MVSPGKSGKFRCISGVSEIKYCLTFILLKKLNYPFPDESLPKFRLKSRIFKDEILSEIMTKLPEK